MYLGGGEKNRELRTIKKPPITRRFFKKFITRFKLAP